MTTEPVVFESNGLRLEGILHLPATGSPRAAAVICHPHPLYGGEMRNSVVGMITRGLIEAGLIGLTFNFRGVGRSEGRHDNGAGEQDDTRAALEYVRGRTGVRKVALAGYSFGAGTAAGVVDASIAGLALIALPTRQLESAALSAYEGPVLFATGSADNISSLPAIEAWVEAQGDRATVAAVDGADHSWWGYEDVLSEAVRAFFAPMVSVPDSASLPGG